MPALDILNNKEELKKLLEKSSLFISLYENFKQGYKDSILGFYANEIDFEDGEAIYRFTDIEGKEDKTSKLKYEKEVYRTIRSKDNKNWDKDASLFNWLRKYEIITAEQYEELLELRKYRNKLVHELDKFIGKEYPKDLDDKIKELLDIRMHASKRWYILFELPLEDLNSHPFDINATNPDDLIVYDNNDLLYLLIKDTLE